MYHMRNTANDWWTSVPSTSPAWQLCMIPTMNTLHRMISESGNQISKLRYVLNFFLRTVEISVTLEDIWQHNSSAGTSGSTTLVFRCFFLYNNLSRKDKVGGENDIHGWEHTYRILVWKPVGRTQLGKPWHRWKANIKSDLK